MEDPEEEYKRHLGYVLKELKSLELHAAEGDPLEFKISTVIGGGLPSGREERSLLRKLMQMNVISPHEKQWFGDNFEKAHRYFLKINKKEFNELYNSLYSPKTQKDTNKNDLSEKEETYDVIFSLAGEQKQLGQEIKNYLAKNGLNCWIYTEHEHLFPGRDQTIIFEKLFKDKSSFCIALVSKEYVEKKWTTLEGKYIKDRWMNDEDYLIPVNIDVTRLLGLPELTGYISTKGKSAKDIAQTVIATIQERRMLEPAAKIKTAKYSYPLPRITKSFDHLREKILWIDYFINELKERVDNVEGMEVFSDSAMDTCRISILLNKNIVYSLDIHKNSILGGKSISFFGTFGEIPVTASNATNAWGTFLWSKEKDSVVIELFNASMLPTLAEKKHYTKEELVDELWQYLVDHIDRNY